MNLWKVFTRGIIEENPYFVLALSLCPGLAVTTSVINGLTMGCTVWFVITANNTVVSIIHKLINKKSPYPCLHHLYRYHRNLRTAVLTGLCSGSVQSLGRIPRLGRRICYHPGSC